MGRIKTCKICGDEVKGKNPNQIYCRPGCSGIAIFRKQKARRRERRLRIFRRDNWTCVYCGKNFRNNTSKLEVDHKIPRTNGGSDEDKNLATSCFNCNRTKGKLEIKPGYFIR